MLVVMKGLPLAYNRDMQGGQGEGFWTRAPRFRLPFHNGCRHAWASPFCNTQNVEAGPCGQGFLNATEFADYLVSKGIPFREAHHAAGKALFPWPSSKGR